MSSNRGWPRENWRTAGVDARSIGRRCAVPWREEIEQPLLCELARLGASASACTQGEPAPREDRLMVPATDKTKE
jgi:hypothetical protein